MSFNSAESASILISTVSAAMLAAAVVTTAPAGIGLSKIWQPEPANAGVLDLTAGIPLTEITNASALSHIRVESSTGEKIGESKTLTLGTDGKVAAVGVAMGGGLFGVGSVVKKIEATDLIYLHDRRTLVSRLTKSEIAALPAARESRRAL